MSFIARILIFPIIYLFTCVQSSLRRRRKKIKKVSLNACQSSKYLNTVKGSPPKYFSKKERERIFWKIRKKISGSGSRAVGRNVLSILSLSRNGRSLAAWIVRPCFVVASSRSEAHAHRPIEIRLACRSRRFEPIARTHAHTATARDSRASLHATGHVCTRAHKLQAGCKCALNSAQQFCVRDERSHAPAREEG